MKKLIFLLTVLLGSTTFLSAQDCLQLFPTNEGAVLINKNYDANKKLLSTMTYRVNKSYGGGNDIQIGFNLADANDKSIDNGSLEAYCEGDRFFLKMSNNVINSDVINLLSNDTELVGDFLDYPDVFGNLNDIRDFNNQFEMTGGEFTIRDKVDKKAFYRVRVYNRKYLGTENVTTPAGTFNASKVTFDFEVTNNKTTTTRKGVEWYAVGAGIVRSETYDKQNKLLNYTELTTLREK